MPCVWPVQERRDGPGSGCSPRRSRGVSARRNALARRLAPTDVPALLLSAEEARRLRAGFADSNRAFTARYLGEARDDLGGRRFSDEERDEVRRRIEALGIQPRLDVDTVGGGGQIR